MRIRPAAAAAVLVALVAACKRPPAGERSCEQAGVRVHELSAAQLATSAAVTPDERAALTGLLAPMRDSMVRACRDQGWSAAVRACFADAAATTALAGCNAQLSPAHRAELIERAARK